MRTADKPHLPPEEAIGITLANRYLYSVYFHIYMQLHLFSVFTNAIGKWLAEDGSNNSELKCLPLCHF